MTQKNKERSLNLAISIIVPFAVVFLTANLSGKASDEKEIIEKIDLKADKIYVDDRNADQNKLIKANTDKIDDNYEKYEKKVDKIYDYILSLNTKK